MKKPGLLSVLFGVIGLGLLAGALALVLNTRAFIVTAKHASGTVTELVPKRDKDDGSTTYTPVVMFEADSGASVSFTSSFSSNPPSYDVGEKVDVLYAPAKNPESGHLHVFNSENLWFDPTQHVTTKQLRVLLDPNDATRYHIDVSFLPQLAPGS